MDNPKMFECVDDDFMVKGHDKAEIIEIGRMHAKEKHGLDLSDDDVEAKIKES